MTTTTTAAAAATTTRPCTRSERGAPFVPSDGDEHRRCRRAQAAPDSNTMIWLLLWLLELSLFLYVYLYFYLFCFVFFYLLFCLCLSLLLILCMLWPHILDSNLISKIIPKLISPQKKKCPTTRLSGHLLGSYCTQVVCRNWFCIRKWGYGAPEEPLTKIFVDIFLDLFFNLFYVFYWNFIVPTICCCGSP